MKKLITPILAIALAIGAFPARAAGSVSGGFNVVVTLTSACQLSTAPGPITLGYTAFTGGTTSATTSFAVLCTVGLPYTLALNTANADTLGLTIPLDIRNSGDTAAAAGGTGAATATSFLIKASVVGPQQGTCATATCSSTIARTLTVSY